MIERKGLRFEILQDYSLESLYWQLVGADGPVCESHQTFETEAEARSDIAAARKRMKACQYAKVLVITDDLKEVKR